MKKFWKKHRQNNQGLTLIEMVITVAIIGIVSVVVLSIGFHRCKFLQRDVRQDKKSDGSSGADG